MVNIKHDSDSMVKYTWNFIEAVKAAINSCLIQCQDIKDKLILDSNKFDRKDLQEVCIKYKKYQAIIEDTQDCQTIIQKYLSNDRSFTDNDYPFSVGTIYCFDV